MRGVEPVAIGRRQFLVGAGRGALGVAVLGLAGCRWDAAGGPDEETAGPARGVDDPSGAAGTDPRYALGMATADLLARRDLATPTGLHDGSEGSGYWEAKPGPDRTWDLRGATFAGHFDCDATEADTYPTGRYNSPRRPTDHQRNSRPVRLGYSRPAVAPAVIGGTVTGDQSAGLGWTDLKHGSYIQGLIDAGTDPDLAYDQIVGNTNMDGDPRVYFADGSWAVVDGLRCHNTWDGFGIYGTGSRTAAGTIYLRNCWFTRYRDDGIENDEQRGLHLFDCLFEDGRTLLSTKAGDRSGSPVADNTQTVERCVVRLSPSPGGHKRPSTDVTAGYVYKMQANSPPLLMRDTVVAMEGPLSSEDGAVLPTRAGDRYENVTVCWLGSDAYPGNTPPGVTVVTGTRARTRADGAVAAWKARHGVTDFDTVDMERMLAPLPFDT